MTNFIELTGANSLINTMARVVDRKQWVADFTKLWNSEFLKNRRDRGKIDVVQEEIMRTLRSEKDPFIFCSIVAKFTQLCLYLACLIGSSESFKSSILFNALA